MADNGIYTKNADIQALAGANANSTSKATTFTDVIVLNVEAMIDVETGFDWSTNFGDLDQTLRNVLTMAGAAFCAMIVVDDNPDGFTSREYETKLDFLNAIYDKAIAIIKDKDGADLIKGNA